MSVVPQPWPQPAPQLVEAVAAMYRGKRERPLPVLVRDKLGEWLLDEQFAGAYGVRGKPGWSPSRLALVTIFQKAEDLTDRQAAECVRTRIDWKYALGLDLADPGFDHSILSEFRARVAAGGLDQVVLDTLLERLAADGLVGAGGTMRTDSTHVISAVRDLNRLGLAGESVRACLEQLVVAAPQLVAQLLDNSWGTRYAARVDTWRTPAATARQHELALAYGRDGHTLHGGVRRRSERPSPGVPSATAAGRGAAGRARAELPHRHRRAGTRGDHKAGGGGGGSPAGQIPDRLPL